MGRLDIFRLANLVRFIYDEGGATSYKNIRKYVIKEQIQAKKYIKYLQDRNIIKPTFRDKMIFINLTTEFYNLIDKGYDGMDKILLLTEVLNKPSKNKQERLVYDTE